MPLDQPLRLDYLNISHATGLIKTLKNDLFLEPRLKYPSHGSWSVLLNTSYLHC